MSRRLDIAALQALQAVSRHGGVTRAADALSLSQSAVSHKIKRLEENIGCNLLQRRAGAPLLTEAGERLLEYTDRILDLHDEALQSLGTHTLSGKIRLGMTEDISSAGLARILGRFTRLFPDISVRTHVAQSLTLQQQLKDGTIDLAVMQVFRQDVRAKDLVLFRDALVWAKAIDLELDWDQPIPFLAYDDNCFYKSWMLAQQKVSGLRFETVLQCTSNSGIIAGVESGLGVSILNHRHVSPNMVVVTDAFVQPPDIAYVVRAAMISRTPAVNALAGEIARETSRFDMSRAA